MQAAVAAESAEARAASGLPRAVSGLLAAVLLAEVALLVFFGLRPAPVVDFSGAGRGAAASPKPLPPLRPVLGAFADKPLFAALPLREAVPASAAPAPSAEASKLAARLNLLGIVDGTPPQAIIEDSQTQKTYFAVEGQAVAGGAVVESVGNNGVVLNYLGETFELSL